MTSPEQSDEENGSDVAESIPSRTNRPQQNGQLSDAERRRQRVAAALRDNLQRRKQQKRDRSE